MNEEFFDAYMNTDYTVFADPEFVLEIGKASQHLDALLQANGATTGAFITAWNPYSVQRSDEANRSAQQELLQDLHQAGITTYPALGRTRLDNWPGEESIIAIGLTRDAASRLALQYRQNAWLGLELGQPVVLLWSGKYADDHA